MSDSAAADHRIEWAMTSGGWKVYDISLVDPEDIEVREPTADDWAQRREKRREQEWLRGKPGLLE